MQIIVVLQSRTSSLTPPFRNKKVLCRCYFPTEGPSFFAYRSGQFVLVDIPLQFDWRSPEWWGLMAGALQDLQRRMKTETVVDSSMVAATSGAHVVGRTRCPVADRLESCGIGSWRVAGKRVDSFRG